MDIPSAIIPGERGKDVKTALARIGTGLSRAAMNLIASEDLAGTTPNANKFPDRPFVIRGHHLMYLTPLMAPTGTAPEKMAADLKNDSVRDREDLTEATVDFDALTVIGSKDPARVGREEVDVFEKVYAFDLVGETPQQASRFERSLLETFQAFLSLPDDATVELTATKKDEVCGACTFQKHCEVPAGMEKDVPYLGVYEDVVRHLAAAGRDVEAPVKNADGSLYVTVKSVREVMSYFAIGGRFGFSTGYTYMFDDAIRRRAEHGDVFGGPDLPDVERYNQQYA